MEQRQGSGATADVARVAQLVLNTAEKSLEANFSARRNQSRCSD
jgi:hypothetical protein